METLKVVDVIDFESWVGSTIKLGSIAGCEAKLVWIKLS